MDDDKRIGKKFQIEKNKLQILGCVYVQLPASGVSDFSKEKSQYCQHDEQTKIYNLLDGSSQSCEQTAIASSFSSNNSWLVTSNLDLANASTSKP